MQEPRAYALADTGSQTESYWALKYWRWSGLVGVLLSGLGMLRDLNREVASALNPSTATPTPLIMAVVLPEGHTPPDAQGNTQPNEAEIPPNLLPIVQSLANLPLPTPGPGQAIRIEIPALTVDAPVVQGDGWDQLKKESPNISALQIRVNRATWFYRRITMYTVSCSATWINSSPATK